jgi:hypothetical protein
MCMGVCVCVCVCVSSLLSLSLFLNLCLLPPHSVACLLSLSLYIYIYAHTHTHAHTHTLSRMHTLSHSHTHTLTHPCTHTLTHTHSVTRTLTHTLARMPCRDVPQWTNHVWSLRERPDQRKSRSSHYLFISHALSAQSGGGRTQEHQLSVGCTLFSFVSLCIPSYTLVHLAHSLAKVHRLSHTLVHDRAPLSPSLLCTHTYTHTHGCVAHILELRALWIFPVTHTLSLSLFTSHSSL